MLHRQSLVQAGPDSLRLSRPGQGILREPGRRYSRHAIGGRMERAMSLGAVPDADEMSIGGMWMPGRQVRTRRGRGVAVAWVTDKAFPAAGPMWADLGEKSTEPGLNGFRRAEEEFQRWPGLQPFLLSGLGVDSLGLSDRVGVRPDGLRPWDTGEKVSDPEDTTAIDRMDAAQVLEGWWRPPGEDELLLGLIKRSKRSRDMACRTLLLAGRMNPTPTSTNDLYRPSCH